MREDEAHWTDDVRRSGEEQVALSERLAQRTEGEAPETTEAAMDQLGRGRGGRAAEVALLAEEHGKTAASRIAGDAAAVYAPADNGEIVDLTRHDPRPQAYCPGSEWRIAREKAIRRPAYIRPIRTRIRSTTTTMPSSPEGP